MVSVNPFQTGIEDYHKSVKQEASLCTYVECAKCARVYMGTSPLSRHPNGSLKGGYQWFYGRFASAKLVAMRFHVPKDILLCLDQMVVVWITGTNLYAQFTYTLIMSVLLSTINQVHFVRMDILLSIILMFLLLLMMSVYLLYECIKPRLEFNCDIPVSCFKYLLSVFSLSILYTSYSYK